AGLLDDEEAFTRELLTGQPDAPTYFGRMKRLNVQGPPLLGEREPLPRLDAAGLAGRVNRDVVLGDTRPLAGPRPGFRPGPRPGRSCSWPATSSTPSACASASPTSGSTTSSGT